MATDANRLNQLRLAGAFCLFDRKLRSSGNSSVIWGILNVVIGAGILSQDDNWGIISLVLGLALIAAGLYERTVRDPKVIIISAGTLAGLALWNAVLIGLAAAGKVRLALGGRTLFWAIAQAWGAFTTWKTYSTYKTLKEQCDPLTLEQVQGYVDELKKMKADQTLDLIEFEANSGFVEGRKRYRLKPIDDLYVVTTYKDQLRSLNLEEVTFVPRSEVSLTPGDEKWMSKRIKATIQLGGLMLHKASITPEMASRINPSFRAIAIGQT